MMGGDQTVGYDLIILCLISANELVGYVHVGGCPGKFVYTIHGLVCPSYTLISFRDERHLPSIISH